MTDDIQHVTGSRPLLLVVAFAALAIGAARADAAAQCPYIEAFRTLQTHIAGTSAAEGLAALNAYAIDPAHENPNACESMEIARLMSEREVAQVWIAGPGGAVHPQAAYRCMTYNPRTTACNGAVADGTAHPDRADAFVWHGPAITGPLEHTLPDTRLIAVFRASEQAMLDGKPAKRLQAGTPVTLGPAPAATAFIAIFSAPPPWRYRKFVWYYGPP